MSSGSRRPSSTPLSHWPRRKWIRKTIDGTRDRGAHRGERPMRIQWDERPTKESRMQPPKNATSTKDIRAAITFPVSAVEPATAPLDDAPYHEAVSAFLGGPVEACSSYYGKLIASALSHL